MIHNFYFKTINLYIVHFTMLSVLQAYVSLNGDTTVEDRA
jgi:hypothetical protein